MRSALILAGGFASLQILLAGVLPGHAADMAPAPVAAPAVAPAAATASAPPAVASGWYLRGDLGYGAHPAPSGYIPGDGNIINASLRGSADLGIGVGYQVQDYLRLDGTLDYVPGTRYAGTDSLTGTSETASISMFRIMGNVYYDIGTFNGLTPYVGAGLGVSNVSTGVETSAGTVTRAGGASRANLAWALMAGVSYPVTPNLAIDAGYRFVNDGRGQSVDAGTGAVTYSNIRSHEFRAGLRYLLN